MTYTNKMGIFSSMMNLVRKGDSLKMDGLMFLHIDTIDTAIGEPRFHGCIRSRRWRPGVIRAKYSDMNIYLNLSFQDSIAHQYKYRLRF